jgi:MOSC domain-containing protein YiiM/ferredoxin-NADP reductase
MDIPRQTVLDLENAPWPQQGTLLQVRTGSVGTLGEEQSGIFKSARKGPVFVGKTGLDSDEHAYHDHGGIDRAIHQYDPDHYSAWREQHPPHPELFQAGAFGENFSATNMTEANVCIGDVFRVGKEVLLQVSEPRNPCYKLNIRFEWPKALNRIQRAGKVGWNYRVLQTGLVCEGDSITLVERPHPRWSVMNVQRVIQAKSVLLHLLNECANLEILTAKFRNRAQRRLESMPKIYKLVRLEEITPRVRKLLFKLQDDINISEPAFKPHTFANIKFGGFARSYSIVSGDLNEFTLGVALDDNSRGGSKFLHTRLQVGDEIEMSPCSNPKFEEDDKICASSESVKHRLVIVGGIGITAFLSMIQEWERDGLSYEVHYAVRSMEDAAFVDLLTRSKTHIYPRSRNERLDVKQLLPDPREQDGSSTRIFCSGPPRLIKACKETADLLDYPEHLVHLEYFGGFVPGSASRSEFEVEASEADSDRREKLTVPPDMTLLQVLTQAGFGVMSSCNSGGCGACKVTVCGGEVEYNSTVVRKQERGLAMQACVDRGIGKLEVRVE